jgi:cytochrome c oxidase cbb3-type subunit 4
MNFGLIHSVWTVLLFVLFIGIIVWAWSAKRKKSFDQAARLPLEDEVITPVRPTQGKKHG